MAYVSDAEKWVIIKNTCKLVQNYVSKNAVPASLVPKLIVTVHDSLRDLKDQKAPGTLRELVVRPSDSAIRASIRNDGLVSFVDGCIYQTLKRHLTSHGLQEHSYRERYGLPEDYPMVSPSYSKRRSVLAKAAGLGTVGNLTGAKRGKRVSLH